MAFLKRVKDEVEGMMISKCSYSVTISDQHVVSQYCSFVTILDGCPALHKVAVLMQLSG